MVVDDHHVGGQRLPPRRHHETIAILCAGLPQAVFARRGREAPRECILRYLRKLALVSAAADAREARDTPQVSDVLASLPWPPGGPGPPPPHAVRASRRRRYLTSSTLTRTRWLCRVHAATRSGRMVRWAVSLLAHPRIPRRDSLAPCDDHYSLGATFPAQ